MQWQGLPNTHICLQMCELVLKVLLRFHWIYTSVLTYVQLPDQ